MLRRGWRYEVVRSGNKVCMFGVGPRNKKGQFECARLSPDFSEKEKLLDWVRHGDQGLAEKLKTRAEVDFSEVDEFARS